MSQNGYVIAICNYYSNYPPNSKKIEDLETLLYETYAKKENQSLENLKKVKLSNLEKNLKKILNISKSAHRRCFVYNKQ